MLQKLVFYRITRIIIDHLVINLVVLLSNQLNISVIVKEKIKVGCGPEKVANSNLAQTFIIGEWQKNKKCLWGDYSNPLEAPPNMPQGYTGLSLPGGD